MAAEVATLRAGGGRELATRVVVGTALAVVTLGALWLGSWPFKILVSVFAVLAWREMFRLVGFGRPYQWIGYFAVLTWALLPSSDDDSVPVLLIIPVLALLCLPFRRFRVLSAIIYIAAPALGIIQLRGLYDGFEWVAFIFAVVWSSDIAAYAVGRTIGGPKLWPNVSANKTWAGFAGACFAACAAAAVVAPYVHLPTLRAAVAGLLLGALAQAGDLFESALKRRAGVKDSGNLLPGHGGVLDRIDSLIPVAPAVAGAVALGWL